MIGIWFVRMIALGGGWSNKKIHPTPANRDGVATQPKVTSR